MSNIITLTSDIELEKEFLTCIKRRDIEQKFIYLGENAYQYYNARKVINNNLEGYWHKRLTHEDFMKFIKKLLKPTSKKVALVSLGCGNAKREIDFLDAARTELQDVEFNFIGVDSSISMLYTAQEAFTAKQLNGTFLRADYSTGEFNRELKPILEDTKSDQVIYLFIGSTLGNSSQTEIVDTLYNVLESGNILYLDVMTRNSKEKKDDLEIFDYYSERLHNPDFLHCNLDPLTRLGIPKENIKVILKTDQEDYIGVLCFKFYACMKEPITVIYRNERIHFLPPEEIKFVEIRTYHTETMISFFHNHNLELIDYEKVGNHGQFAFIKK